MPCPGKGPVVVGCAGGNAQNCGSFLQGNANPARQFYQFGFDLVVRGEFVKGVIDCQELVVIRWRGHFHILLITLMERRMGFIEV